MSLDITLYTDMPAVDLHKLLVKEIKGGPFAANESWTKVHPPGRFDSEVLGEVCIKINIVSRVFFRVNKFDIRNEYAFLKLLLGKVSRAHEAAMLLNGETVMFAPKDS